MLVVDDDALIAMTTVDMLEDLGFKVIEANSGTRALEVIKDNSSIDLLITDYAMPRHERCATRDCSQRRQARPADFARHRLCGIATPFRGRPAANWKAISAGGVGRGNQESSSR